MKYEIHYKKKFMFKIFNNSIFASYPGRLGFVYPDHYPTNRRFSIHRSNKKRLHNSNPYLKRAVGNFIKGVIHGRFPHVSFQDHASLILFLENFDPNLKYTAQALSNVKMRRFKYKPLENTPEVNLFIKYIQKRFPHFKDEWLFNDVIPISGFKTISGFKAFRLFIYYKYISMELVFIFKILPNFYLLYLLVNFVVLLMLLMIKDLPLLLKTIEFVSNNNNYFDDFHRCDEGLTILYNLRELDLKVLNPIMQINFNLRNLSKSELDELISIINTESELDKLISYPINRGLHIKLFDFININKPFMNNLCIKPLWHFNDNIQHIPNTKILDEYTRTIVDYGLKYDLIPTNVKGFDIIKTSYLLNIDPHLLVNKFSSDLDVNSFTSSSNSNSILSNKSIYVASPNPSEKSMRSLIDVVNNNSGDTIHNSRNQLFDLINTQNNILANKQSYIYNFISPTINDANTALDYNNDFIEKTLKELKYYTELVSSLELKLELSNDSIDNLNNAINKTEIEKQSLISYINEVEDKDNDDESDRRLYDFLRGEIDTKEQLITDLTKGLDTCLLKQDELKTEVSSTNSTIVAMELELKESHDDSITLRNKVVSLENLLSQERTKFAELTDMNSLLKDHIATNSVEIENAKLIYRENDNHLETINTLENYTKDLEKELRDAHKNLQTMKSNHESLASSLNKLVGEIDLLNAKITELDNKLPKV